jgi:hypothetical protein
MLRSAQYPIPQALSAISPQGPADNWQALAAGSFTIRAPRGELAIGSGGRQASISLGCRYYALPSGVIRLMIGFSTALGGRIIPGNRENLYRNMGGWSGEGQVSVR